MTPKFYRPKRKGDLIRHIEAEHPMDVTPGYIEPHRWTMAALVDLHDGIHRKRVVES